MGFYDKVVRFGEKALGAFPETEVGKVISPIALFEREQFKKLNKLAMDTNGTPLRDMAREYFSGRNIMKVADEGIEYSDANEALGRTRKIVAGAAIGLGAANALGINPGGVTDKMNNLAALGGHYAVGRTLMRMGGNARVAGIGYLGATAINTLRAGDNTGPM